MINTVLEVLRKVMSGSHIITVKKLPIELTSNGKLTFSIVCDKDGSITVKFIENETVVAKVKKIVTLVFSLDYIKVRRDNKSADIKINSGLFDKVITVNLEELQETIGK